MAVKTHFSNADFVEILAHYALGNFLHAEPITQGSVQTNYRLHTSQGRFVLRCYENRTAASVRFETHLLTYLTAHHYPCPAPQQTREGAHHLLFRRKPLVIFEFLDGAHVAQPTETHKQQLIRQVAALHTLTQAYRPFQSQDRWHYNVDLCRKLGWEKANEIDTAVSHAKFAWLDQQLQALVLPAALPKGICHCDFHFSNVLFQGDQFVGLLDFDDANVTYLTFDLVGLMESWAWPYPATAFQFPRARPIVAAYAQHRPLQAIEQQHLFDVHKLAILFDCIWYFARGSAADFYEKQKIDFLNDCGRAAYAAALFG